MNGGRYPPGWRTLLWWTVDAHLLFGSASGPKGGTIDQVYKWWANPWPPNTPIQPIEAEVMNFCRFRAGKIGHLRNVYDSKPFAP